jgi:hypothetical protein
MANLNPIFAACVSSDIVKEAGVDPVYWEAEDQSLLEESMVLSLKENPEWTEEQAKAAALKEIDSIVYLKFLRDYKFVIHQTDEWYTDDEAYAEFLELGLLKFTRKLNLELEFAEFCRTFYEELRERYNVAGAEMREQFELMKANHWTFSQYRTKKLGKSKN